MSLFNKFGFSIAIALSLALFSLFSARVLADDAKKPDGDDGDKTEAKEADEFAVPDGSITEIVDFIRKTVRRRPKGSSRAEMVADFTKIQNSLIEAADKVYAKSLDDKESGAEFAGMAVQVKTRALQNLQMVGDSKAVVVLKEFATAVSKDERPEVAKLGEQLLLQTKFQFPLDADEASVNRIAAELKKQFGEGELPVESAGLILKTLQQFERTSYTALTAELYDFFAGRFEESGNKDILAYASRLKGTARRVKLPGNPIDVEGQLLDGGTFDWSKYKGKVVLVDYWATWCGPCIRELPNVLSNYAKYHDRGFEVIGISLDEDREKVEKFVEDRKIPWKTLYSDDPETNGWQHPMATRYGIGGIPTVILVNQEGNVVSLNARGDKLGELLAELLGPAEEEGS